MAVPLYPQHYFATMSIICRQQLIAPIVISIFNVAVAIISTWITVKRPSVAPNVQTNLHLVTVIWTGGAIQFWVALAAILLYTAPAPIERSYVVVAAGIIGNLYNDVSKGAKSRCDSLTGL